MFKPNYNQYYMSFLLSQSGPVPGAGSFVTFSGSPGGGIPVGKIPRDYSEGVNYNAVPSATPGFWGEYALNPRDEIAIDIGWETPIEAQVRLHVTEDQKDYLLENVLIQGLEIEFEDHLWRLAPGLAIVESFLPNGSEYLLNIPFASVWAANPWHPSLLDKPFHIFQLNEDIFGQRHPFISAAAVAFRLGIDYQGIDLLYPIPFNTPAATTLTLRQIIERTVRTFGGFIDYTGRGIRIREWDNTDRWDYDTEKLPTKDRTGEDTSAITTSFEQGLIWENASISVPGINSASTSETTVVRYEGGCRNDDELIVPGKVGSDGDWLPHSSDWLYTLPTPDNQPGTVQSRIIEKRRNGEVVETTKKSYGWMGTSLDVWDKVTLPDGSTAIINNPPNPQSLWQIYRTESSVLDYNRTTDYWELTVNEITETGRMSQEDAEQKQALNADFDLQELIAGGADAATIRAATRERDRYLFNQEFPLLKKTQPTLKFLPYPEVRNTVATGGRKPRYVAEEYTEGDVTVRQPHPQSTPQEDLGEIAAGITEWRRVKTEILSATPIERFTVTTENFRASGESKLDATQQDPYVESIGRVQEAPKLIGRSYVIVPDGSLGVVDATFRVNSRSLSEPLLTSQYWSDNPDVFDLDNPEDRIEVGSIGVSVVGVRNQFDLATTLVTYLRIENARSYKQRARENAVFDDRIKLGDIIIDNGVEWRVMGNRILAKYDSIPKYSTKEQTLDLGFDVSDLELQVIRA